MFVSDRHSHPDVEASGADHQPVLVLGSGRDSLAVSPVVHVDLQMLLLGLLKRSAAGTSNTVLSKLSNTMLKKSSFPLIIDKAYFEAEHRELSLIHI